MSEAVAKRLIAASAGECGFDGCLVRLYDPSLGTLTGEVAHIHARKPGGPRFNAELTREAINDFPNLMFLCPLHHYLIDGSPEQWDADLLRDMKQRHEASPPPDRPIATPELDKIVSQILAWLQDRDASDLRSWLTIQMQESLARCVGSWQALGLSRELAAQLVAERSVGAPSRGLVFAIRANPLVFLRAEMGSGKTLVAERLIQTLITETLDADSDPRLPLFVSARAIAASSLKRELADIETRFPAMPLTLVVDGLDEVSTAAATRLLQEAHSFLASNADHRTLITTRPLAILRDDAETNQVIDLVHLADAEAFDLVSRVAGTNIDTRSGYSWPSALTDAIHRPLFALLMGLHLRGQPHGYIGSPWALLQEMVERVVSRDDGAGRSSTYDGLLRLAVAVTEAEGPIRRGELGGFRDLEALGSSRFVTETDSRLDFQLPALTRWFAAQALIEGQLTPEWICTDPKRLDRWEDAVRIALVVAGTKDFARILRPIVATDIGFVGRLLEDHAALREYGQDPLRATDPIEMGNRFRDAITEYGESLGPLAEYLPSYGQTGAARQLGFSSGDGWLSYAWNSGDPLPADVVGLPPRTEPADPDHFYSRRWISVQDQSGWDWVLAYRDLREAINDLLQNGELPPEGVIKDEAQWRLERLVGGSWNTEPLIERGIINIEEALGKTPDFEFMSFDSGLRFTRTELEHLVSSWKRRAEAGEVAFRSPWSSDREPAEMTSIHPDFEQVRRTTELIFAAAIDAYAAYAKSIFAPFAHRLRLASLLPVVVKVDLVPQVGNPFGDIRSWAGMSWHWEPLPIGSTSVVEVNIVSTNTGHHPQYSRKAAAHVRDLILDLRPDSAFDGVIWYHQSAIDPRIGSPVSHLVYSWLWSDLQAIGWGDGTSPSIFEYS